MLPVDLNLTCHLHATGWGAGADAVDLVDVVERHGLEVVAELGERACRSSSASRASWHAAEDVLWDRAAVSPDVTKSGNRTRTLRHPGGSPRAESVVNVDCCDQ